jgi:amino acid transporter
MSSIFKSITATIHSAFAYVFIPTLLTLIGTGFFLRIGWLAAHAGPLKTITVISLSVLIILITLLSILSTFTNMKIEQGGIHCLLSTTFGPEISAAMSLPLLISQGLSASLMTIGFVQVLHLLCPSIPVKEVSLLLMGVIALLSFVPSKFFAKVEFFYFAILCFALYSFYFGPHISKDSIGTLQFSLPSYSFWVLFSMFFPIVIGSEGILFFTHHLKHPEKSMPLGLLAAIGSALFIYLSAAHVLYLRAPLPLLTQPLILQELSLLPFIIILAIAVSSVRTALGCIYAASQNLQFLAQDHILPKLLKNPMIATFSSLAIAFLGIFFGNPMTISPILTIFCLIAYGTLNTATGIETLIANPSWRPTLKVHWLISLLGAALCCIVMLMINPGISLLVTGFIMLLYTLMKKRHLRSSWEDMRYSILLFFSRYTTYKINTLEPSPKTWRPNLLVFIGDPLLRAHLAELTAALTHKKGFLIVSSILSSAQPLLLTNQEENKLSSFLEKSKIPALVKIKHAPSLLHGMKALIEDIGLGTLSPNTIVLGASEKEEKIPIFAEIIRFAYANKKNILIIRENGLNQRLHLREKMHQKKSIDVWWGGRSKNNSELMVILSYMLQTSESWKNSLVTLKTIVNVEEDIPLMKQNLASFLISSRLYLHTSIALHKEGDIFSSTMKTESQVSDLVFLGMKPPEEGESLEAYASYYGNLLAKTKHYPPIAYTLAGETLEFDKILS